MDQISKIKFAYTNYYSDKKNGIDESYSIFYKCNIYSKWVIHLLLLILVLLTTNIEAQSSSTISIREIKLSGLYFYGEGIRETLKDAKSDALSDLQYKMSVTLNSKTDLNTSENGSGVTEDYSKSIQMTSIIKLKGIEYFDKKLSSGEIKVLAYVSKELFASQQIKLENSITELINYAEQKEIENGLASTISTYYTAYLKTYLTPNAIPFSSKTFKENYSDARIFLEQKIKSFLKGIVLNTDAIEADLVADDLFDVNLNVAYDSKPVNNITVSFDLPNNPTQQISKGKVTLFLYSQPSNVIEEYKIVLKIPYEKNDELLTVHKLFPFVEKQRVELDFTELVKIDFKIKTKSDTYVKIVPVIENLSISSIMWQLDSGVINNDDKLLINLDFEKNKNIVLMVNNKKSLSTRKQLTKDGELIDSVTQVENIVKSEVSLSPIIEDLVQCKTYDQMIAKLIKYKNEGKIIFGKESNFINIHKCYGIVINPNTRVVSALFTPKQNKRKDLINKIEFVDYHEKFKGKAIIWLQLN